MLKQTTGIQQECSRFWKLVSAGGGSKTGLQMPTLSKKYFVGPKNGWFKEMKQDTAESVC